MRQDDRDTKSFFRSSDRVFHMNGSWYFATREGDEGPYPSEVQAQAEIRRFITEKTELAHFQKAREEERMGVEHEDIDSLPTIEVVATSDMPTQRPVKLMLAERKLHI